MNRTPSAVVALTIVLLVASPAASSADPGEDSGRTLDPFSYAIGNFSTFAEIVDIGIKKVALSQALPAAEMDPLDHSLHEKDSTVDR